MDASPLIYEKNHQKQNAPFAFAADKGEVSIMTCKKDAFEGKQETRMHR